MQSAVLATGDKLHVMTRRLFEADIRRHFVGEVLAHDNCLTLLKGYTFILNLATNEYRRLPEIRTRLFSLAMPAILST